MACNGLVKKLKNGLKRAVLIGTALAVLGSASCKFPTPTPTPNNLPTAILNIVPTEINTGESSRIQLNGFDLDGKQDIIEYRIGEDKNNDGDIDDYNETIKTSSNSIDEIITFDTPGIKEIYGQVTDSQGATASSKLIVNVSSSIDLNSVDKELDEETEKTIYLPTSDINNNPIEYIEATPLDKDGNGSEEVNVVRLNNNELTLRGRLDVTGPYCVKLKFRDSGGYENTATLEGIIHDLLDVSGQLQDNESDGDIPRQGITRIYDSFENFLREIQTDANGYFSTQLNERVSNLDGIIIRAGILNELNKPISFVTIERRNNVNDITDLIIRPIPCDDLINNFSIYNITLRDYKDHVYEVPFDYVNLNGESRPGLIKWNFGEYPEIEDKFRKVKIIQNSEEGYFSEPGIDIISRIIDPNDIGSAFEGKIKIEDIEISNDDLLLQGYINIIPDENPILYGENVLGYTKTYDGNRDGYLNAAKIVIEVDSSGRITSRRGFAHEVHHSAGDENHTEILADEDGTDSVNKSIMTRVVNNHSGPVLYADKKRSKIRNESTYHGGRKREDTLTLDFPDMVFLSQYAGEEFY